MNVKRCFSVSECGALHPALPTRDCRPLNPVLAFEICSASVCVDAVRFAPAPPTRDYRPLEPC